MWIVRKFDQGFTGLTNFYDRTLQVVLRHRRITLLVTLDTLAVTVLLAMHVPKGFFPIEDTGTINAVTEAAPDVSFQRMTQLHEEVVGLLLSQVLTLYTTPVIYLGMDRVARALRRFRGKPEHEPPPEVSGGDPGASDDIPHEAATESK